MLLLGWWACNASLTAFLSVLLLLVVMVLNQTGKQVALFLPPYVSHEAVASHVEVHLQLLLEHGWRLLDLQSHLAQRRGELTSVGKKGVLASALAG